MSDGIPLFEIPWDESDVANVVSSVSRGSYWAKGPYVDSFEEGLESYFEVDHALTVNSGTTALECALRACGIGEGDEVIVPSFTFIATANTVRMVGATPIFADIEPDTYGLDPNSVRNAITEDTAAIVPVHVYGAPCRIHELAAVADEHDLYLIEDAAEAFGATADGELVGTIGDVAALSFCQNKILPTGEGGAVITDNDELARSIAAYRSHGRTSSNYFDSVDSGQYERVGSNYRMPDIVAALGCSQLEKVDDLIDGRRKVAETYRRLLRDVSGVEPHTALDADTHVYQLFTVEFDTEEQRRSVISELSERDISCKIYWMPGVHATEAYNTEKHIGDSLDKTEKASRRVLALPMYADLPQSSIHDVANGLIAGLSE
ncbi:DegT/DnrJ/EryC1/StrS family aminotransferase [Haloferax larsenii]|uniref:DegT/DnrJ/EryC1/StrS family aminotransferase n=1 Tax=Haloferax larsenii TaxID=302484 RepID=A0ABY5RBQ7_HALLR|nr:DegT/DnrJ/EryC1/StrS family aminotransferase [Haloferax larsenii]UVE49761.1 DegT/DnrJ/EryC1/StrS family aminotransferase [Haloferax larsenii]